MATKIKQAIIAAPDPEVREEIITKAWEGYDASKKIKSIDDISALVSTNRVFKVTFDDDDIVIAKLSYFGKYEYFKVRLCDVLVRRGLEWWLNI